MQALAKNPASAAISPSGIIMPEDFPSEAPVRIHIKIFTPEPLAGFNERPRKPRNYATSNFREPDIKIEQAFRLPGFMAALKADGLFCSDFFYYLGGRDNPANVVIFQKKAQSIYLLPPAAKNILSGLFWKCEAYIHEGDRGRNDAFKLWPNTRRQDGHIYNFTKKDNIWKLS